MFFPYTSLTHVHLCRVSLPPLPRPLSLPDGPILFFPYTSSLTHVHLCRVSLPPLPRPLSLLDGPILFFPYTSSLTHDDLVVSQLIQALKKENFDLKLRLYMEQKEREVRFLATIPFEASVLKSTVYLPCILSAGAIRC